MMKTMIMGRKMLQTVLFVLGMVAVAIALPHSTVDATTTLSTNGSSLRRRPAQKVRGVGRDLATGKAQDLEKDDDDGKGESKSKSGGKREIDLPAAIRPTKNGASLEKMNQGRNRVDEKESDEEDESGRGKPQQHGTDITVGSHSSNTNAKESDDIRKRGNNGAESKRSRNKNSPAVENGVEHFQEVEVEVYRRQVPKFSIHFTIDDPSSGNPPNLADYNELSEVSEEYLDNFFRSVFEDIQVRHDGTILFVSVNDDNPFTVDFVVTLEFIIPGEVPTVNFLIDRLQEGLERDTSMAFFISDLSTMSETNPFSKTVSIEVVSRPPLSAAEMNGGGNSPLGNMSTQNKHIMISFLAGIGSVILVVAGFMWVRKTRFNKSPTSDSDQTFALFDKSNTKGTPGGVGSSGVYGADEETISYLNSIRKRYKDRDETSKRGSEQTNSSVFRKSNISAAEVAGSFDEEEDSICDTASTGSQIDEEEKKDRADVDYLNSSDVEDDLLTIN